MCAFYVGWILHVPTLVSIFSFKTTENTDKCHQEALKWVNWPSSLFNKCCVTFIHVYACKPAMNCRCKYYCKIFSWMFLQYTVWGWSLICWAYWNGQWSKSWCFVFMKALWRDLMFCTMDVMLASWHLVWMAVLKWKLNLDWGVLLCVFWCLQIGPLQWRKIFYIA